MNERGERRGKRKRGEKASSILNDNIKMKGTLPKNYVSTIFKALKPKY